MSEPCSINDAQVEFNRDRVWNLELCEFSHNAVIFCIGRVQLNHALVNAHLPVIVGLRPFTIWSLSARDNESSSREWYGPTNLCSSFLSSLLDCAAHSIELLVIFRR